MSLKIQRSQYWKQGKGTRRNSARFLYNRVFKKMLQQICGVLSTKTVKDIQNKKNRSEQITSMMLKNKEGDQMKMIREKSYSRQNLECNRVLKNECCCW